MLELRDIRKSYATPQGALTVLAGVDLTLGGGETLALTGESGSGKSTVLHIAGGLDQPDAGEVRLGGVSLTAGGDVARSAHRRHAVGVVFQQFNLIPSLTVDANLAFQARLAGTDDALWRAHLAERLGITGLLDRYPEQLSGGQQQRVAIGRAIAARPSLLLADEPTGNLDPAAADAALALTLELVAETGAALLLVTHSARVAGRLDRRARLENGRLAEEPARTRRSAS